MNNEYKQWVHILVVFKGQHVFRHCWAHFLVNVGHSTCPPQPLQCGMWSWRVLWSQALRQGLIQYRYLLSAWSWYQTKRASQSFPVKDLKFPCFPASDLSLPQKVPENVTTTPAPRPCSTEISFSGLLGLFLVCVLLVLVGVGFVLFWFFCLVGFGFFLSPG